MAYNTNFLSELGHVVGGRSRLWVYNTADAISVVLGAGYISDAGKKRIQVGDVVLVASGTLTTLVGSNTVGGNPTPSGGSLVAAGVTSEFASGVIPTWQPCIVSAVSAVDSKGVPTQAATATLQLAAPSQASQVSSPRNLLDGGDATINPWQRGTSITGLVATNTYTADRWFLVAGSSSSATMVKTADTTVPGFSQSFAWGRGQSTGIASSVTVGQALESLDSIRAQGQVVTFSFYARANTGYTVNSSPLAVTLAQGFGTDQSASALVNGTWTTQTNIVSTTQVLTSTMTRYSFSATVSNTATQLGVLLSYTGGNTTATTAENVIMNGLQLEIGGLTPFEHREIEQELAYCQRYFFQVSEPGTSGTVVAAGGFFGTNTATFLLTLPVQMRAAPTVTVTNGSFGALINNAYTALTSMAAGSTHTVNYVSVLGNATGVSNCAALLISSSASVGKIAVSADL